MIIKPTPGGSELPELHNVITPKGWTGDKIKLKIAVKMDKPVNLKKCGLVVEHLSKAVISGGGQWRGTGTRE